MLVGCFIEFALNWRFSIMQQKPIGLIEEEWYAKEENKIPRTFNLKDIPTSRDDKHITNSYKNKISLSV